MLEVALDCIRRGWYVFPCMGKEPLIKGGFKNASKDEAQVREWWEWKPKANVGIATGASMLTVLDIDKGIADGDDLRQFCRAKGLAPTYTVRTGRRDGFGAQLYFHGGGLKSIPWSDDEDLHVQGDIRSSTGYVMAAGSIHPVSGEAYSVMDDAPVTFCPPYVADLKPRPISGTTGGTNAQVQDDGGPISESRNVHMISLLGRKRNEGAGDAELEAYAHEVNETRMVPPLEEAELNRLIANACKFPVPERISVTIGGKTTEPPADPWEKYHTFDEIMNVTPGKFIVDGVLYENSITALAGYAGDRKSIVSLNLAAACVSGRPFMGHFAVSNPPKRVIYLCPEMGLRELKKLAVSLGMVEHTKTRRLLFRSLDKAGKIKLRDLTPVELDGSLVILDTAVRFIEGSENDPQDMAVFADELFRLRSLGATVWVLFHSGKSSVGQELSLQNAVRGSSEIAAMLSMCWATRLNEPAKRFDSTSRLYPLKVREFDALPFDFSCDRATAACGLLGEPAPVAVLKDRKAEEARRIVGELLKADPTIGINRIQAVLKERTGSGRKAAWVGSVKRDILGSGAILTEQPIPNNQFP